MRRTVDSVRRDVRAAPVAVVAGVGGAVIGGLVAVRVLLTRQAALARRRIGKPLGEQAIDADRLWRRRLDGAPIELLLFGDSIAAGLGATVRKETLGARLAKGLARERGRPVLLRTGAVVGAESAALAGQLDRVLRERAAAVGSSDDAAASADDAADELRRPPRSVAVVIVGGNDITHRVPVATSTAHLAEAIARLRQAGIAVVVGTCPDLGALRAVPQPLRSIGSRLSRQLAAAQAVTARAGGAEPVSLRRAVGHAFLMEPDEMFSMDRFHPSALGYRRTADALLPALLRALPGD